MAQDREVGPMNVHITPRGGEAMGDKKGCGCGCGTKKKEKKEDKPK